jgi:hypothetical protein
MRVSSYESRADNQPGATTIASAIAAAAYPMLWLAALLFAAIATIKPISLYSAMAQAKKAG